MPTKPRGWGKFDSLMRKLVTVPKDKVEAKIASDKGPPRKKKK